MVLRGLELHGIAYDHVLETVVDVTPEQRQGFAQVFDLVVTVTTIDSWQMEWNGQRSGLRVLPKWLPVPIECSDVVQPIVLLQNKSGISSEELLTRGAYFSVCK